MTDSTPEAIGTPVPTAAEVAAFAGAKPATPAPAPATPSVVTVPENPHVGYASGSPVLDLATFTRAFERLVGSEQTVEEEVTVLEAGTNRRVKQKVKRAGHETDPPSNFKGTRKIQKPGSLPALVLEASIAKGAKTLEHDHAVPQGGDLDLTCYHLARHVVAVARARQATAIALRKPHVVQGMTVLPVVLVL